MDNNYNKYCSGQLKIISDFDKINEIFEIVLKNHINNQGTQNNNNNNITILDIGCSHGKNSIIVLKSLIEQIRNKWNPNEKVIEIFHSDLSGNDFSKLFNQVYNLNSYSNKTNNIFTYGIGNAFENQLVPNNSIDFIFSFSAMHWVPFLNEYKSFEGSLYIPMVDRLAGFENYYKEGFLNVLNHRYNELKVGGIFSFNILIQEDKGNENEEKSKSLYYCLKNVKDILREMSYESILSRKEVENMIAPATILSRDEYQYAIDKSTNNTGLKLIYENRITTNWADSYHDDDSFISSIIAIFGNSIKNAINGDKNRVDSIFNNFEQRLHLKYKLNPNDFQFHLLPNNSIDFIFSFTTIPWVPFLNKYKSFEGSLYNISISYRLAGLENYYKERLLNTLNHRYNELKVGGIFSFNIFIQEDKGSENEEKSKSTYNCMKNIKDFLREMSYESILSREEVENMIVPLVLLTRDEYQYAIDKSTNNTGLKLIYENRITRNWADSHHDGESYIGSIIAVVGNFIKNAINGDKNRVDSIFNDFEQRLHLKYKLNPNDFLIHLSNLYLSFLKEN
ncbi:hypothetical protein ACTFIZ_005935 [Dictyostelium cf. discoideum]